jgi:hypothetical protein
MEYRQLGSRGVRVSAVPAPSGVQPPEQPGGDEWDPPAATSHHACGAARGHRMAEQRHCCLPLPVSKARGCPAPPNWQGNCGT